MSFTLSPGISFCEPDGQRIFLDLAQDRYFALGAAANEAFTRLVDGESLSDQDHARLSHLSAVGMLRPAIDGSRPVGSSAPPIVSAVLDEHNLPAAPILLTLQAAIQLRRAKADVARVPLARLCAAFVARKAACGQGCAARADVTGARLARAFQAASRLVGSLDHCLALSLALGRSALAYELAADIVFGVKVRPFQAHAWLQISGVVLSDRFDTVRPFTPILAL